MHSIINTTVFTGSQFKCLLRAYFIHGKNSYKAASRVPQKFQSHKLYTVGVKLKFPFGFCSTEQKRYTVLTKNSYKTDISKH